MRSQRGQALVLLVLTIVGMLGFAALALDGGMLFTERRRAQNAADNAALAGALKAAQTNDADQGEAEALSVATANAYVNGAETTVTANKPPVYTANPNYNGNSDYLEVTITQTVSTSFIHLVYGGPARLTVSAIAKAQPSVYTPVVIGQALVALDPSECSALWFSGNNTTTITGGGAFSNSSCPDSAGRRSGSGDANVPDGVDIVGGWRNDGGGGSLNGPITTGVPALDLDDLPEVYPPPCDANNMGDEGNYDLNGGTDTIDPGRYDSISVRANGVLYLNPGLYCLSGDFDARSGAVIGAGVLIYMQGGSFQTNGGAENSLSAPTEAACGATDPDLCDHVGLLIYVDPSNSGAVQIAGNSRTTYTGLIYAQSSECTITGNSGSVGLVSSQVICATAKLTGNAMVSIDFDEDEAFEVRIPPEIELTE